MTHEQRVARLARARFWMRVELAIGALAALGVAFLLVTGRRDIGPASYGPRFGVAGLLPAALGIVGVVLGVAWMVWLARQNPERGKRTWRYSLAGRLCVQPGVRVGAEVLFEPWTCLPTSEAIDADELDGSEQ